MSTLGFIFEMKEFFTGIWTIAATYGIWGFFILGCLAFAWFSPVFKKTALWCALGCILVLVSYGTGVHHGESRRDAQHAAREQALSEALNEARAQVERDVLPLPSALPAGVDGLRPPRSDDPFDRDNDQRLRPVAKDKVQRK